MAHSVDSDIFYAMIHLPSRFQDLHQPLFLKVESNQGVLPKLRFKSTPPTSNNILSEDWIGFTWFTGILEKGGWLDCLTSSGK